MKNPSEKEMTALLAYCEYKRRQAARKEKKDKKCK